MIVIENLSKTYKNGRTKTEVLKNINLTIARGEFVSIVGPSGCGKTTLLNTLSGLDRATTGRLSIDGENLEKLSDSRWAYLRRQKIGYVFQNFNLLDDYTVLENLELTLKLKGYGREEGTELAKSLLAEVGLPDRLTSKPGQLSGGQKQRVAIARALAGSPEILLADEPTGALDENTAKEIMALLRRLCREKNMTVIMVTHDNALSLEADRRIEMLDGRITSDTCIKETGKEASEAEVKGTSKAGKSAFAMVAKRNMKTSKRKIFLTSFGMAIGIAATLLILGIGSGIKNYVSFQFSSVFDKRTIYTSVEKGKTFTDEDLEKIENIEGVSAVYPYQLFTRGVILSDEKTIEVKSKAISVSGAQSEDKLIAGSLPAADDAKEIVVSLLVARELTDDEDVSSILGKKVSFVMAEEGEDKKINVSCAEVTICGVSQNTVFGLINFAMVPYKTCFELYDEVKGGKVNGREYVVVPEKESLIEAVSEEIKTLGINSEPIRESMGVIDTVINVVTALFVIFVSIALIIAGVMMAISFRMSIIEKTREIGILRALGFTRKDVRRVFLSEGAAVGLMGGALGAAISMALGAILNAVSISRSIGSLFELSLTKLFVCVAISVLWGVICVHAQAKKASRLNPVEALFFVE